MLVEYKVKNGNDERNGWRLLRIDEEKYTNGPSDAQIIAEIKKGLCCTCHIQFVKNVKAGKGVLGKK